MIDPRRPFQCIGYGRLPNGDWCAEYEHETCVAHTEADARAKMLVYLIENKLIAV